MLAAPGFAAGRMSSLTLLAYAGAPMDGGLLNLVAASFPAPVYNVYGTTETMNSLYAKDPAGRAERTRPGFYSRIRVSPIGGSPGIALPPGEEGELLVDASADATFSRYLEQPRGNRRQARRRLVPDRRFRLPAPVRRHRADRAD